MFSFETASQFQCAGPASLTASGYESRRFRPRCLLVEEARLCKKSAKACHLKLTFIFLGFIFVVSTRNLALFTSYALQLTSHFLQYDLQRTDCAENNYWTPVMYMNINGSFLGLLPPSSAMLLMPFNNKTVSTRSCPSTIILYLKREQIDNVF